MERRDLRVSSAAGLVLLLAALFVGCGGAPEMQADQAEAAESAAQEEQAPAAAEQPAPPAETKQPAAEAQPAPAPRPRTTKPATQPKTEPAPAPRSEPRRITLTATAATELAVQLDQELNTKDTKQGDGFTATVMSPVTAGDRVVVPVGSQVHGVVTAVQGPDGDQPAVLKVDFTQIDIRGELHPLHAIVAEATPEQKSTGSTAGDVAKVGGGAVAGAILGRVIGGDKKGTLIGAAVGAAAGTAVMLATKGSYGALPAGTELTLRLEEPVHVTVEE